jgi:hypothetical protein
MVPELHEVANGLGVEVPIAASKSFNNLQAIGNLN